MQNSTKNCERGFTLIELLIAMAIALVVITSISSAFISQRKTYAVQEQITAMTQDARAALDMISREVRMAGFAPTGYDSQFESDPSTAQTAPKMQRIEPTAARFVGIPYDTTQLEVIADLSGDGTIGDASHEKIVYKYYDTSDYPKQIKRSTNGGTFQPFAENIQSFAFEYYKSDGTTTTTDADIRQIEITVTARTSKPDPNYSPNGGYRRYTLTTYITPPNLDL
jgi:type IV pilus assembly protein PilW